MIGDSIPGLWDFYIHHAQPAMIALARAGNRGVWVDQELRAKLAKETESELEGVRASIKTRVGRDINPGSPQQLAEFLYDEIHIQLLYDRRSRRYTRSTKEQILEELMLKHEEHRALLTDILTYREKQKLLSTFLTCELDSRGKLVTSYNATGTVGGRISSSQTILKEGANMQQFNRGPVRRMVVAPPGRRFVKVDLSQAEARVVAWIARDRELIELFLDPNFDVHKWNAVLVFGVSMEQVTKDLREKAKQRVHAANYHGGVNAAAKIARIPYAEAKTGLGRFWSKRPILKQWWAEIDATVQGGPETYFAKHGFGGKRWLRTGFGRKRVLLGRLDQELFRSAYSFLPSATVADIINQAFYQLDAELPEGDWPVLQVHDELVIECDEGHVNQVAALVKQRCEVTIRVPEIDQPLLIPAEVSSGPNWFDMEKLT